jgi:hypothetical protein
MIPVLRKFELLCRERVWEWARLLRIGAILAPGKRTVRSVLRVMGLSDDAQFQNYHRVLNRAVWSPYAAGRSLLRLLVDACSGDERYQYGRRPGTARRCRPSAPPWPSCASSSGRSAFLDGARGSRHTHPPD